MPYVMAGYTEADVSAGIPLIPGATAGTTLDGWLVGGGMEMRIAAGVILGAEYRYSMFDTLTIGGPGGLTIDTDRHEVRATLKYKANFF
jgi:opacity protein-like surface antigen